MSMWGMNDGATLTQKSTWTNDDATLAAGSPAATYVTDGVEAGDVLVGFDGLLYRVVSVTSETALEVDRVYEGSTASNKDVTRMKLPRHLKITNDDAEYQWQAGDHGRSPKLFAGLVCGQQPLQKLIQWRKLAGWQLLIEYPGFQARKFRYRNLVHQHFQFKLPINQLSRLAVVGYEILAFLTHIDRPALR